GAQPAQTAIDRRDDVVPIEAPLVTPDVGHVTSSIAGPRDLRRHDDSCPYSSGDDPTAQYFLRATMRFRKHRGRIVLGGIEQVDTGREGHVQLSERICLRGFRAEGHHAEPGGADTDVGLAELPQLHVVLASKAGMPAARLIMAHCSL